MKCCTERGQGCKGRDGNAVRFIIKRHDRPVELHDWGWNQNNRDGLRTKAVARWRLLENRGAGTVPQDEIQQAFRLAAIEEAEEQNWFRNSVTGDWAQFPDGPPATGTAAPSLAVAWQRDRGVTVAARDAAAAVLLAIPAPPPGGPRVCLGHRGSQQMPRPHLGTHPLRTNQELEADPDDAIRCNDGKWKHWRIVRQAAAAAATKHVVALLPMSEVSIKQKTQDGHALFLAEARVQYA
jgi:hypothetical protein